VKIVYVLNEDISRVTGVTHKVISQISIWNEFGNIIKVIALNSTATNSQIQDSVILTANAKKTLIGKFLRNVFLIKSLKKELEKFKPDLIYSRYICYIPCLVKTFKAAAPYIIEINTNDIDEIKQCNKFKYFYNILTRRFLLNNADGFVFVSNELKNLKCFKRFQKPSIMCSNAIGIKDSNITNLTNRNNRAKHKVVFIGTLNQPWHGIDKIIFLANSLKNIEFNIIGYTHGELISYINNYKSLFLSHNIICHGFLNHAKAINIIANCDVGIGSLALHRNKMNEASPLKVRQYLALGLPIIIGYQDTDLMGKKLDFVLELENTETNIANNLDKIKKFIYTSKTFDNIKIREFSIANLGYQSKEEAKLNFFKRITQSHHKI